MPAALPNATAWIAPALNSCRPAASRSSLATISPLAADRALHALRPRAGAAFSIDLAYSAIEEAEYAVLDSVLARKDAAAQTIGS
jgi:hypothetical protein